MRGHLGGHLVRGMGPRSKFSPRLPCPRYRIIVINLVSESSEKNIKNSQKNIKNLHAKKLPKFLL